MGTNEEVRKAQQEKAPVPPASLPIVSRLAQSTGVAEEDVKKVLEALNFFKVYPEAVRLNGGEDLQPPSMRIAFKLGKMAVVM